MTQCAQELVAPTHPVLHCIGFGSQARAWAECLRASGWRVHPYLGRSDSPSLQEARDRGFEPALVTELPARLSASGGREPALIAMLCPDTEVGPIYRDFLAPLESELTLVLAHGYAVYAGELQLARLGHEVALLAPKAIGPKIWALYREARSDRTAGASGYHRLVAGFHAPPAREAQVRALAEGLAFAPWNLAQATFEQEAVGDLLSEQGLLCGGVFTLLEWTIDAMARAGVPSALIHEECLTELELIAGLLRERGPATTFRTISQAAQCGTVAMRERLSRSGAREQMERQFEEVLDRRFAAHFREGAWKNDARDFARRLERIEADLTPAKAATKETRKP